MSELVSLNLRIPASVAAVVDALASDLDLSKVAVVRRALGVLHAAEQARAAGHYVGTTRNREHLEQVLVGPL